MKENWFLLGDIHGDIGVIEYFYNMNKDRLRLDERKNYLLLLGDVGCNYAITGSRDSNFKRRLSEFPFTYILLRGNHEARVTDVVKMNPEGWMQVNKYDGKIYIEKEFPNIEYLSDIPAVYKFAGKYKTLSIPGAYSVDKHIRLINNWQWFENEQLSEEEMQYGRELIKNQSFDLVISHTCPIAFEPRDLFLKNIDQSRIDKSMELYLGEIEADLDYRRWAWGHFHSDRIYPWDGEKEKLMLFNEFVDLDKYMNMSKSDYLIDILA